MRFLLDTPADPWLDEHMENTVRDPAQLIRGAKYTVRGTISGQVGATFRGRFGAELLFRTSDGRDWSVPVAYFQEAHPE